MQYSKSRLELQVLLYLKPKCNYSLAQNWTKKKKDSIHRIIAFIPCYQNNVLTVQRQNNINHKNVRCGKVLTD